MRRFLKLFRKPKPAPDPDPLFTLFLHATAWYVPDDIYCVVSLDRHAGVVVVSLKACCCRQTVPLQIPPNGSRFEDVVTILNLNVDALRAAKEANHARKEAETPEGGIDLGPIEFHVTGGN